MHEVCDQKHWHSISPGIQRTRGFIYYLSLALSIVVLEMNKNVIHYVQYASQQGDQEYQFIIACFVHFTLSCWLETPTDAEKPNDADG